MSSEESHFLPNNDRCIHGNKVIEITYDDIHLGTQDARCPYYGLISDFDPTNIMVIHTICKGLCKVTRQNLMVEKLAFERAKIQAREAARFNAKTLARGKTAPELSVEEATKGD